MVSFFLIELHGQFCSRTVQAYDNVLECFQFFEKNRMKKNAKPKGNTKVLKYIGEGALVG